MLAPADGDGLITAVRQKAIDWRGRRELARRRADDLRISRLTHREVDFGGIEIGGAAAQARLTLGHVSRRHIAGVETFFGRIPRLAKECNTDTLRLDQRLVAVDIGIGGDGIEQHFLPDIAQGLAAGLHLRFGLAHGICGLETVEQRLADREADGPRLERGGLDGVVGQQIADLLQAGAERRGKLRPVAGERLGDVLVRAAQPRPFGIELRIALISAHQRIRQRLRASAIKGEKGCENDERSQSYSGPNPPPRGTARQSRQSAGRDATTLRHAHEYEPGLRETTHPWPATLHVNHIARARHSAPPDWIRMRRGVAGGQ